ncbi:MAG: DUF58 domain-containing protein [Candidatus Hodarchaeales archaeon]|jgi:uncharacterized protein (DUF58 family)
MLSSRGAFIAIGGIILLSVGLSAKGIGTVTTMVPILFEGEGLIPTGSNTTTSGFPPGMEFLEAFEILNSSPIVDYSMFLGTLLILASVIGLPFFQASANASFIRVTRKVDREKAFAGEYVHVTVRIENTGKKRFDFLEIYDAIPDMFEIVLGENFIITQLAGKEVKEFSYIIQVSTRGVYKIGPVKVIIHDRLGFYFEEDVRHFYTEVLCYPSYEDIRRMEALSKRRQQGKMFGSHKTRQKGMGDDFHALARYYPGAPFKSLDWKAFSRTGELMVREFEAEKNIRLVLFLDHSGSMGAGIPYNTKLDFAIRATMLVMKMAEERQDLFGLLTYADRPTSYLPPKGGKNMFFQLLEILALVEPEGRSDPLAAVDYVMQRLPRASFYVFLTDLESSDSEIFTEAAKRARSTKNKITVISPFGPLFETKLTDLTSTERAIAEAIFEEYLGYRKQVEDSLRGLGVEIINVGPDDILPNVIKTYMKGKQAGKGSV